MAYFNDVLSSNGTIAQWISNKLEALREERRLRAVYRQTYRELSELSQRELADLGIDRANIREIALEAARNA